MKKALTLVAISIAFMVYVPFALVGYLLNADEKWF